MQEHLVSEVCRLQRQFNRTPSLPGSINLESLKQVKKADGSLSSLHGSIPQAHLGGRQLPARGPRSCFCPLSEPHKRFSSGYEIVHFVRSVVFAAVYLSGFASKLPALFAQLKNRCYGA